MFRLPYKSVADLLVNAVGGWIVQVGEQGCELPTIVQELLSQLRNTASGVPSFPVLRGCIDHVNRDAMDHGASRCQGG